MRNTPCYRCEGRGYVMLAPLHGGDDPIQGVCYACQGSGKASKLSIKLHAAIERSRASTGPYVNIPKPRRKL